jgi:MFS family permease
MTDIHAAAAPAFGRTYRSYALGLLTAVYVLNFIDRQIVVILQESIRLDLGLMDWQLGLLSGFAFAIFYCTLGIPIARIADRGNRTNIIAISIAVWSAMTALCGAAQAFWQLLLARIGVGVGEAGCSPPAHSIISDLYPPKQRSTALSIYNMGIYIGVFFGYLAGGWLDEVLGWRIAFLAVGLPGVLVALVVKATLREPPRGMSEQLTVVDDAVPLQEVFMELWNRRSFRHLSLAAGLHAFVGYGAGNWMPPFLARAHEMGSAEISTWLGPIAAVCGAGGAFLGGWLTDRYGVRDARWYIWIPAGAIVVSVPLQLFVYMHHDPTVALLVYTVPVVLGAMYLGPMLAMVHGMVQPRMRAFASSILFFVLNLVGLGLGPLITGIISDVLAASMGLADGLRWALVIVTLANVWCVIHYLLGARTLKTDLLSRPDA